MGSSDRSISTYARSSASASWRRRKASIRAAVGSIASRASYTSPIVVPLTCSRLPTCRAATDRSGVTTWAPPRAPRRTVSSDSASRIRNASRSVGRDTPNCSCSSASGGSRLPGRSSPRTIWPRSRAAISSAVFGARTAGRTASVSNRSATQSRS